MRKLRRVCGKIILIFFLVCLKVLSLNLPQPTSDFFVNDFANVLKNSTKEFIMKNSVSIMEKTQAQIVVTVVSSLQGSSVEEYALSLCRSWKVGSASNNGAMLVLAPYERKIRVEVGRGLEGVLNDSKIGWMFRSYAQPSFKDNNWDFGILNLYTAIVNEVAKEYNIDNIEAPGESSSSESAELFSKGNSLVSFVLFIYFGLNGLLWICFAVARFRKRHKLRDIFFDDDGHFFGGGGSISFYSDGGDSSFGGDSGSSYSGGGGGFDGGGFSGDF